MQPLLNLKSFLAILLVLAIPGALLVAFFRNYSSEAGGHEHAASGGSHGSGKGHDRGEGSGGKSGDMPMKSHEGMAAGQMNEMPASMDHDNMKAAPPAQPPLEDSGPPALLHIGAKGFFIDRPQTFTPRADQAKTLSDIKERTTMDMMAADKNIQEAEQQLWRLTANERPNLAEIEAKTREVEKLRADQRIVFIRAIAEAANLLTAEQKESLLRSKSPAGKPDEKPESKHQH